MRRAEKEVKDLEQLEEILRDCNTVRIGTQDAEGMFIVPVNYGYDLTEGQLTLYLHSAREGRKAAAFRRGGATDQEREKMTCLLSSGFTDSFRYLYPDTEGIYSWWSYRFNARKNNAGWRIDYFIVSDRLRDKIKRAEILTTVEGSDHCPVLLELDI